MEDEWSVSDWTAGILAALGPAAMLLWALWVGQQSYAGHVGNVGLGAMIMLSGVAVFVLNVVLAAGSLGCVAVASRWGAEVPLRRSVIGGFDLFWFFASGVVATFVMFAA